MALLGLWHMGCGIWGGYAMEAPVLKHIPSHPLTESAVFAAHSFDTPLPLPLKILASSHNPRANLARLLAREGRKLGWVARLEPAFCPRWLIA
jgi:hypothetical protein